MKTWIKELSSKEFNKKTGIYLLILDDKKYVGSTTNIYARLTTHRSHLEKGIHSNEYFQRAFNKSSILNLYYEILEYCNKEDKLIKEKYWIEKLNPCLNLVRDPTNPTLERYSIEKLKKSMIISRENGKYKTKYSYMKVEMYNYTGDYIKTFDSIDDVVKELNMTKERALRLLGGYKKGLASKGIRLRYEKSSVPVQKFKICFRSLSRNVNFYNDSNSKKVIFNGVKDIYKFLLQSVMEGKKEVNIKFEIKKESQLGPL